MLSGLGIWKSGKICASVAESGSYITVVSPDGRILCDTLGEKIVIGTGFSEQPEINSALKLKEGWSVRKNTSIDRNFVYAALPVDDAGAVKAVLRFARPEDSVGDIYLKVHTGLWFFIFAAFAISGAGFMGNHKKNGYTIEEQRVAMALASGDLTSRLHVPSINEMETLAESMNEMASQLNERIVMVSSQKTSLRLSRGMMEESLRLILMSL